MKTKIFLCAFIASMFFLASCTKDEGEKLQYNPDILGTWVNVHHFSNGEFICADRKKECDYIVILGELFEYHKYDVSQSDYITFKDGLLDISLTENWKNEKFEYHTKGNNIIVNGFRDGTYELSSNRLILNFDDKIEVYERVKEVVNPGIVKLDSISIGVDSLSILIGDTISFSSTIFGGSNAAYRNISWSSSDENVAAVSSCGVVSGNSAGTAIVTANVGDKSAFCVVTVNIIPVSSVSLDKSTLSLALLCSETLEATVSPFNATEQTVIWSSSDESVATVSPDGLVTAMSTGTAVITATVGDKSASCVVTTKLMTPVGEAVDLGLSVKWATFNVGATRVDEYGDYFAWGATEPYYEAGYAQEHSQTHWKSGRSAGYSWVNAPYQTTNTTNIEDFYNTRWTKYLGSITSHYKDPSATDANAMKTVLDLEDDAAHVNWGGSWRMPTKAEQDELRHSCTWTWTTLNGVKGYFVKSRIRGYTDNWIFLPAASRRCGSDVLRDLGYYGLYWSSSLCPYSPSGAYYIIFNPRYVEQNDDDREIGRSVRPVCPKN